MSLFKALRAAGFTLAAVLLARPAAAHSFLPEGGFYDRFVEGTTVVFAYPATFLPLVVLGILFSLWQIEGLIKAWPVLLVGQVLGIFAAAFVGTWVVPGLMAVGAVVAIMAALLPAHSALEVRAAAGISGLFALMASLEGHGLFELPLAIYVGILFAANFAVALGAALPRFTFERSNAPWLRIVWRVAASWIAAVLILYFAFAVSS